jgi:hypothetical protein
LHLNYITGVQAKDTFKQFAASSEFKKQNELAKSYNYVVSEINNKQSICVIMFHDEQGNFERTNKTGWSAKELFVALRKAVIDELIDTIIGKRNERKT